MKKFFLMFCILLVSGVLSARENDVYKVVDGDSLELGDERIRLIGIDAPEYLQDCYDNQGEKYRCGLSALEYLQSLMKGKIKCNYIDKDRYGRSLSECFNEEGININRQMVVAGWAISYGDEYIEEEQLAKQAKIGVWQGKFMRPELFRALNKGKVQQKKNKKR